LSQFDELREHQTSAPGYEPTNDEIVATVEKWNAQFGVAVSEVGPDRFTIQFKALPDNLDEFSQELYAFCPNIIEQDFGNYEDILDSADAWPPDYIAHVRRMSEGIDFTDPDYPYELLKKSLRETQRVAFMWD
jgi:hypothetical protein